MANNLQFTAAVTVPNLQRCKVGTVFVDEDGGVMLVQIQVLAAGGVLQRRDPWTLSITNGQADGLVAHPAPSVIGDALVSVRLRGGGNVATAFTAALAAYQAASSDRRGALLTALKGITGTVDNSAAEVGALAGTVVPVLPAGVVS